MYSKKQGKGKGKHFEEITSAAFRESEDDAQFPNAIKKGKHIMALMRDNKSYKLAKILDVRKP